MVWFLLKFSSLQELSWLAVVKVCQAEVQIFENLAATGLS